MCEREREREREGERESIEAMLVERARRQYVISDGKRHELRNQKRILTFSFRIRHPFINFTSNKPLRKFDEFAIGCSIETCLIVLGYDGDWVC